MSEASSEMQISSRNVRTALKDIDSRIRMIEKRLQNAKVARDSYVDYVRSNYTTYPPYNSNNQVSSVVSNMATADYHWDGTIYRQPRPSAHAPPKFHKKIPVRGPYLSGDLKRIKERIGQISEQLHFVRQSRFNMSTNEYFNTHIAKFVDEEKEDEQLQSIAELRRRLNEIPISEYEPPATPTPEQIRHLQLEKERNDMIEEIRSGKVPIVHQDQGKPQTAVLAEPKDERIAEPSPAEKQIMQDEPTPVAVVPTSLTAPSQRQPEPKPSSYTSVLNLLSRKQSTSSDDDIFQPPPRATKTQPPKLGNLSMYFNNNDSSSSNDIIVPKQTSKKPVDPDSDDDFFR